jgi:hypothetical protein
MTASNCVFLLQIHRTPRKHGHPRYTKNLDVWIDLSAENALKIVEALKQFGFRSLGLHPNDFLVQDQVIQLGQSSKPY